MEHESEHDPEFDAELRALNEQVHNDEVEQLEFAISYPERLAEHLAVVHAHLDMAAALLDGIRMGAPSPPPEYEQENGPGSLRWDSSDMADSVYELVVRFREAGIGLDHRGILEYTQKRLGVISDEEYTERMRQLYGTE